MVLFALLAAIAHQPLIEAEAKLPAEPIVVEGRAPETLRKRAETLVRSVALVPEADQFARWNQPVCLKVSGLDERPAALVREKLLATAREGRVKLAKAGCAPNLLVIFTGDSRGLVKSVAARRTQMFESHSPAERRELLQGAMPVRWWYELRAEGRGGHKLAFASPALELGMMMSQPGGLPSTGYSSGSVDNESNSGIGSRVRLGVASATVVVDANLAAGHRLDSVAAYVSLVALAPTRLPPRAAEVPSITGLFEGAPDADAADLSAWDRAYLTALYQVSPDRAANVQRAAIAGRMAEAIGAP